MNLSHAVIAATVALAAALVAAPFASADPAAPTCTIVDLSLSEGDSGSHTVHLNLQCSNPTGVAGSAHWESSDGTATSPDDYLAFGGDASVPPGLSLLLTSFDIVGDTVPEPDETFAIDFTDPAGVVQFTQPRSTVTIQNDDVPSCALADTSVPEGDSGTTTRIQVVAQCDAPLTRDLTLHVTSADGTATADQDYAAINLDNDYAAGQTTLPVEVEIDGDVEAEPDETFTVKLTDQSGSGSVAFTKDTATVTITDDDSPTVGPCILLSDTSLSVSGIAATPSQSRVSRLEGFTVANCGTSGVKLEARATDATGAGGAAWQLTDFPRGNPTDNLCQVGPNVFAAAFGVTSRQSGDDGARFLTSADQVLVDPTDEVTPFVFPAGDVADAFVQVAMPCMGSVGLGEPMSTQITLTAVAP